MSKIINFCKPVYADLIAGKLLLHPILLTAAFLVASSGAFWLIDDVIFGCGYGWDFVGEGIFFMFCSFAIDAYFLTFCSYLLFRAYFTRRHKFYLAWTWSFYTDKLHLRLFKRRYRSPKRRCACLLFYSIFDCDLYLYFTCGICSKELLAYRLRSHLPC